MTKRKNIFLMILAAVMAFALTAAFLLFSPVRTAFAERSNTDWVVIDEIYDDGKSIFKADELTKLYNALTGAGTFESVQSAANGNKTSADFRTQNGGTKNVSVWFGGKKWDAVYLAKDKTGNVVLDLWQSADNVTVTSKWANHAFDNAMAAYPSNMYSTSLIRVQTLNNGGYASTNISTIPGTPYTPKTSESENTYARFTSSAATDSVVSYLVQPKDVAYQKTENAVGNSSLTYTCPNDAYGTPSSAKWYNNYNYAGKGTVHDESKYEAWQNDYLWLPSLAETGNSDTANQNGLWKTDVSLRSTVSKSSKSYAWLRSGYYSFAYSAYTLSTSGGSGYYDVSYEYLVRPALHLNLTAANSTATFAETVTAEWQSLAPKTFYTTGENLLDDIRSYIEVKTESGTALDKLNYSVSVEGSSNQIITAGSYNLKITLNSDDYQFDDGTNSATLKVTVADAKVRVSKGSFVQGFGSFYYASAFVSPMTDFTVTLCENVDDEMFLVKADNGTVTFDLNGKTFTNNIDVNGGTLTLTGSGTVNGEINVQSGKFNLDGSYVKTVRLESGTLINVQSAPASGQITIIVDKFDTPYKVLTWTGEDPTSHFRSSDENACFYKGTGENAAYIGKHSFVFDGEPTWAEPSATFSNIHCEHENCSATATAEVTASVTSKSASCTTEDITYTATVDLSNLQPAFDPEYAAIKGGTITKTKTINGSEKETPTHEWEYSASADGKLTATCNNSEHKEDIDGKKTFTVNVSVSDTPYNGATHPAAISGDAENFPNGYSVAYKYKGFSGADFQNHDGEPKNAGQYQVIISANSYPEATFTLTFTIEKATLTLEWSAQESYTYTGSAQTAPSASIKSGNYDGGNLTVSSAIADESEMKGSFMNAGEYTFVATLGGTAAGNYKVTEGQEKYSTEIYKAQLTNPTGTKILNETYKGTPYEIEISGYESDKMTATRSDNTKSTFDDTTFAATNAGEYKLTIIITDQSNYMWTGGNSTDEVIFTIHIDKATVALPQGETSTEGQYKPEGYTVKISGYNGTLMEFATTGDGAGFAVDGTSDGTYNFTAKNVGEYTLTISLNDAENYEWKDKASDPTFTINISKKELEKPTGSASGAYNGADYVVELANYDNDTMQATEAPAGSTFEEDGGTWKFSARDVGTYSITISLRYPDNYKWTGEGADPVITISIGKTQLSFTLKESSKTYTGLQHSDIDVIFEGDFGHLTKDSDYTLSFATSDGVLDGGLPKGAGSYTVTLKLLGTTAQDYDLEKSTATYTIVKAEITFSLKQATATYTGNKHEDIDVNFTGIQNEEAFTKGEHYTLSFAAQSGTTAQLDGTLPKTVGKYTVTVTLLDERAKKNYNVKTVSQTYEINKAQITVSGEYSDSRDYNGEEYEKTITAAGETNGLTVKMPVADPSFEITIATDKSANTYTGKIEVEYDDVNFALTNSGTYTVTINKAKLTLSLTVVDGGKTYDGYDTATVMGEITKGIFNSDDVEIAEIVANFNDKNVGENKPITVTQVTLGGTMADNYTVVIDDLPAITGNIDKATIDVVWSGYEGLIYDGTPQTITASTTGVEVDGHAEEITLSIAYSAAAGSTLNESDLPQNAGTYTATASTSNGNYALSENSKTYAVAKQQVAAPTIASKVYNRAPQIADVEQSELYEVTENIGGTVVDNYNVKLTLTDSKNYTWTTSDEAEITLIFSITKAEYDMSGVTFEDFSIIYDGEEHSIFISGDLPFEEVTVRYENNGQTAVGKYVIKAIFEGDADNYELIPEKTATLTILAVSHDLSNIIFADVKVKYDGEAHEILIEGELPTNVTVEYEGNGQVDPAIYTIIAIFSDPDGVFDTKEATLTILRTQTQTAPKEESGSGGSSSSGGSGESGGSESGSGGSTGESGEGDIDVPEVFIESEEGFDPTLELVVEKVEDTSRSYLAWGADEVSEKYSVKLCNQDGEEVPIEGKVTVRLLIPEAFRNKDFDLMALAKSGVANASYARGGVQTVAADLGSAAGATSVSFIRDGDYVVFEADGLSEYVFTSSYTPYFPIIIAATGVLLADVAAMAVLAVVIRKKLQRKAR